MVDAYPRVSDNKRSRSCAAFIFLLHWKNEVSRKHIMFSIFLYVYNNNNIFVDGFLREVPKYHKERSIIMRDVALRAALGMGDKAKAISIIARIYLFMLVSNFVSCVISVSD